MTTRKWIEFIYIYSMLFIINIYTYIITQIMEKKKFKIEILSSNKNKTIFHKFLHNKHFGIEIKIKKAMNSILLPSIQQQRKSSIAST